MGMMLMLASRSNAAAGESRHGPAHQNGTMPHPHMQPQQSYPVDAEANGYNNGYDNRMAGTNMLVPGLPSLARNNAMQAAQARAMGFTAPSQDYDGYDGYAEGYEPEARRRRSRRTGRFYRAAADYDMEMRMYGGSGDDDEPETGMAESRPGGGALKTIRKMLKGLESRIEDLQEALEDHAAKKKGKKKKPGPQEEDEDEEDDPEGSREPDTEDGALEDVREAMSGLARNREFMAALPRALRSMLDVLASPPDTWNAYLEKNDLPSIVSMEEKELTKAITSYRLKQRRAQDVYKEITHTGAALLLLFAALLHSEEETA